jgi:transposase-like protein
MTAQFTPRGICAMKSHPRDSQLFPEPRKPRVLRKRSAEERERLLALFERSGQSPKRFCREHEVALSTMTFWRRQARQSARSPLAGVLVEVPASMASADSPRRVAPRSPGSVDIRLPNRVELSVSAGTDSAWVSRLLRELLTCLG